MLVEGKTYRLKTLGELQQTNNIGIEETVPGRWDAYYRLGDKRSYCCNSEMFKCIKKFNGNDKIICKDINYDNLPKFYIMERTYYLQEWMLAPVVLMETE